ncbi:MAG: MFS transporter [Acidimicrobiia bacterium]|nr:MFS transporter [Acidimicrobiia bacterium]
MVHPEPTSTPAKGLATFLVVWAGQLVSVTGTTLTGFGLQIWIYLETGSVTRLALVSLAYALPAVILSPFAGVLADRIDRRLAMLGADVLAGISTLAIAVLYFTGSLQLWHIYALSGLGAIGNALQVPAWMASIPLLVPKKHLGRANGLVMTAEAVSIVVSPAAAGALLATLGLGAVLLADVATFVVAVATLALVRFPRPEPTPAQQVPSVRREMAEGLRYLRERHGLLGLLLIYAGVNFVLAFTNVLVIPLVVSFSSEAAAGGVLSAAGFGMLAGSLAVSAWGGPRHRRIAWVMGGIATGGLAVVVVGLRPSLLLITGGYVVLSLLLPVVNTASQVVWQLKVPPALQGRVYSLRRMLSQVASPLAIVLTGPLADRVFEPLLAEGGGLARSLGKIVGTGTGRGIAFMFVLAGLGTSLMAAIGWMHPRVRRIEIEIPDQIPDAPPAVGIETAAS